MNVRNYLSFLIIIFSALLTSCEERVEVTELSFDEKLGQGKIVIPNDLGKSAKLFEAANRVLQAKCISCHSSGGLNFNFQEQREYIKTGFVFPGSLAKSKLYYRIKNVDLGAGVEDMPLGSINLTDAEKNTIKEWILAMGSSDLEIVEVRINSLPSFTEGSESINIQLQLSKPLSEDIQLSFQMGGTAIQGLDFQLAASTVSIPAGETESTLTLPLVDDDVVEAVKQLTVNFLPLNHDNIALSYEQNSIQLDLIDNDIPYQELNAQMIVQPSNLTLEEADSQIVVSLSVNSPVREEINIPISVSGTAINGTDYNVPSNFITLAKGQSSGQAVINILDDALPEPSKILQINIPNYDDSNNKIRVMMDNQLISYNLLDQDEDLANPSYDEYVASISVNHMGASIFEGDGQIIVTANLDKVAAKNISIPLGVLGEVLPNQDYTLLNTTIDIMAGQQSGSGIIELIDDSDIEADELLQISTLQVIDSLNQIKVTPSPALINKTITSDDVAVVNYTAQVSLNPNSTSLNEGSGITNLVVTLPRTFLNPVLINIGSSGSAINGQDYTLSSQVITIPANSTQGQISLTVMDDVIEEVSEMINLTLVDYSIPGENAIIKLDQNNLSIEIIDNDAAPITQDFAGVKNILTTKCTYCHSHKVDGDIPLDISSESNLSNSSFIVKGNADASKLYYKLKNAGVVSPTLETMPKNDNPLSAEMLAAVKTWIDGLAVPGNGQNMGNCDESSFQNGLEFGMRRLSNDEIKNSIKYALGSNNFSTFEAYLGALPKDPFLLKEDYQKQFLYGQIEAMSIISADIVVALKNDDNLFREIVGSCAFVSPMSEICYENFVKKMAERLYRRPIEQDEYNSFKLLTEDQSVASGDSKEFAKNKFMITLMHMLQSPNFLLKLERSKFHNELAQNPLESLGLSSSDLLIAHMDELINPNGDQTIPTYDNLSLSNNALSLMVSFTPSELSSQGGNNPQFRVLSQSNGSSSNNHTFMIGTDNDGTGEGKKLRLRLNTCSSPGSNCSTATLRSSNAIINENIKSKVVVTFDGNMLNVFHNGILVQMEGDNLRGNYLGSDETRQTFIGANFDSYMPLLGTVHNAIVFNRTISESERDLYFQSTFDQDLQNLNNGTPQAPVEVSRSIASIGSESVTERSQYSIASTLSLILTASPPDVDLYAAAKAGQLMDLNVLKSHARRLIKTPLGKENLKGFIDNWLELSGVTSSPYSNEYLNGINQTNLKSELIDHVKEHGMKLIAEDELGYSDLMGSQDIHINSSRIASLYGLGTFNSSGKTTVALERAGILATPGVNLTDGYFGSLVKRGVRIRRRVLCDPLLDPSPEDIEERDNVEPNRYDHSNREYWRLFTETNPTCYSCHANTNPLGNAFENIDSIGRTRSQEVLYDTDGMSLGLQYSSINNTVTPLLTELDQTEVTGPGELGNLIGNSEKAKACFARQAFEYSYKQHYVDNKHSCFVKKLSDHLSVTDGSGKMIDMFVDLVATKYSLKKINN